MDFSSANCADFEQYSQSSDEEFDYLAENDNFYNTPSTSSSATASVSSTSSAPFNSPYPYDSATENTRFLKKFFPGAPPSIDSRKNPLVGQLALAKIREPLSERQARGLAPPAGVEKTEWFCSFGPPSGCFGLTRGYSGVDLDYIHQQRALVFGTDFTLSPEFHSDCLYLDFIRDNKNYFLGNSRKHSSVPIYESSTLIPVINPRDRKVILGRIRLVYFEHSKSLKSGSEPLPLLNTLLEDPEVVFFACPSHFDVQRKTRKSFPRPRRLSPDKVSKKPTTPKGPQKPLGFRDFILSKGTPEDKPVRLDTFTGHGNLNLPRKVLSPASFKRVFEFYSHLNNRWAQVIENRRQKDIMVKIQGGGFQDSDYHPGPGEGTSSQMQTNHFPSNLQNTTW